MKNTKPTFLSIITSRLACAWPWLNAGLLAMVITGVVSCGTFKSSTKKDDFFTSGSIEADQRASQRMAKDEQLTGAGEKGVSKAVAPKPAAGGQGVKGTNIPAQVEGKLALFDRLGGDNGIAAIVADFMPRVLQDPRVNWQRKEVRGNILSFFRKPPDALLWRATDQNLSILKTHLVQFLVLATGGPAHYTGKEMKSTHAEMRISNPEFDAVLGDLKATLDKLQIPNKEQKEILSIIESTRPQIVTVR